MILRFALLILFFNIPIVKGQNYVGIWHGYVTADRAPHNASFTLDVKTQTGNMIFGRSYVHNEKYPLTEGAMDFIGVINGAHCKITELSILKSVISPMIPNRLLCIKFLDLISVKKHRENQLIGIWNGSTLNGIECNPGEVYLKKITSFATDSVPKSIKQEISNNNSAAMTFLGTTLTKPTVLEVNSRTVILELSDYLREDNDTVSVYYNRMLLIDKLRIEKKVYSRKIRLDMQSGINEIIIYANNLGTIPPNTSNLTVKDGISSRKVRIESTKQTSATIYLQYMPPQRRPSPSSNNSRLSRF